MGKNFFVIYCSMQSFQPKMSLSVYRLPVLIWIYVLDFKNRYRLSSHAGKPLAFQEGLCSVVVG
jgi:hypothetical protein